MQNNFPWINIERFCQNKQGQVSLLPSRLSVKLDRDHHSTSTHTVFLPHRCKWWLPCCIKASIDILGTNFLGIVTTMCEKWWWNQMYKITVIEVSYLLLS